MTIKFTPARLRSMLASIPQARAELEPAGAADRLARLNLVERLLREQLGKDSLAA